MADRSEFNSDYSINNYGIAGSAEIKKKIMAAILSAGVNANASQFDNSVAADVTPYIGAKIGPLSLNASHSMGGFVGSSGHTHSNDAYNTYGAEINSNMGDLNYGLSAEKSPYGKNYNAQISTPLLGGNISGSINRFNPTSGNPQMNAMAKYQRNF